MALPRSGEHGVGGRLKRRLLQAMSPQVFWSLGTWSERRAFWTTIKVRDPELFDKRSVSWLSA